MPFDKDAFVADPSNITHPDSYMFPAELGSLDANMMLVLDDGTELPVHSWVLETFAAINAAAPPVQGPVGVSAGAAKKNVFSLSGLTALDVGRVLAVAYDMYARSCFNLEIALLDPVTYRLTSTDRGALEELLCHPGFASWAGKKEIRDVLIKCPDCSVYMIVTLASNRKRLGLDTWAGVRGFLRAAEAMQWELADDFCLITHAVPIV